MSLASARRSWRGAILAGLALAGVAAPHAADARTRHVRHAEPGDKVEAKKPTKATAKTPAKRSAQTEAAQGKRQEAVADKSAKAAKRAAVATQPPATAKRKGGPLYAVVIGPGPSWKKGQPLHASKSDGHYRYWQDLQSKGLIESAGPVGKDTGFILLHARNQREANALLAADPAIRDGRFRAVARPYAQTLGGTGGD